MDVIAPAIRQLIAPAWALWENSHYLRHHRRLLQTQYDPQQVILDRQWNSIQRLVEHAYGSTRFYRHRLQQEKLTPHDIQSWDDLRRIPRLTKSDLRGCFATMISDKYERQSLLSARTSGSTGISVEVLSDEGARQHKRACTLRADEWSGWRLGERVAMIWGNPEHLRRGWRGRIRNLLLERARYLDTLKMDPRIMAQFADRLRRRPPSLVFGHAHSLFLFAEFLRQSGGPRFHPKAIISTAMVLHDWERHAIEEVFQCPVTNRYGCEEVGLIACECERHQGLHINADGIYLEVLRPDGTPSPPGEPGMVVVTDLTNFAMPMIRYELGDMAVRLDQNCSCGRTLPLLRSIEGRIADFVVTMRGELISGISLTENFATLLEGVAQLQIIQERVDHFVFHLVTAPDFGPRSEAILERLVHERFGRDVTYELKCVDRISQEPSGKFRFCISKVLPSDVYPGWWRTETSDRPVVPGAHAEGERNRSIGL